MKCVPKLWMPSSFQNPVSCKLILNAQVELLDHGIPQVVVDEVDAFGRAAGTGNDGAAERRVGIGRRDTGDEVSIGIENVGTAEAYVDGQGPAVESALQRVNFQRDPVVVNAVAAMNAEAEFAVAQLKPTRGPQLLDGLVARSVKERQQDGIDLVVVTQVIHVGINFIAQSQVQSELRMDAPVILKISSGVIIVCIGNNQGV